MPEELNLSKRAPRLARGWSEPEFRAYSSKDGTSRITHHDLETLNPVSVTQLGYPDQKPPNRRVSLRGQRSGPGFFQRRHSRTTRHKLFLYNNQQKSNLDTTPFVFLADTFFVLHTANNVADKRSKMSAGKQLFLEPLLEIG